MSRVFSIGKLTDEAYAAHQTCLKIQQKLSEIIAPKVICEDIYQTALKIAKADGFEDKFMGISQQAGFIGHGIGLEINESPVFAPRAKTELEPDMSFITFSTVAYSALQLLQPVPKTFISIVYYLLLYIIVIRKTTIN